MDTWLLTVIRNAAIDVVRARHGIHPAPDDLVASLAGRTAPGPEGGAATDPRRPPPPVERLRRKVEMNGD